MTTQSLPDILELVWSRLGRGVADRRHPARHPTLATIGPEGPDLRTLVLRRVDQSAAVLELHTDAASPKVSHIAKDPRVALHIWIPKDRLQIRLYATAVVKTGDPALFASLPPEAQANYGGAIPGAVLNMSTTGGADPNRFAAIHLTATKIDALILDDPHKRALFSGPTWQGKWVAP